MNVYKDINEFIGELLCVFCGQSFFYGSLRWAEKIKLLLIMNFLQIMQLKNEIKIVISIHNYNSQFKQILFLYYLDSYFLMKQSIVEPLFLIYYKILQISCFIKSIMQKEFHANMSSLIGYYYQINQLIKLHPLLQYTILIIQLAYTIYIPLKQSQYSSNDTLFSVISTYEQNIIHNKYIVYSTMAVFCGCLLVIILRGINILGKQKISKLREISNNLQQCKDLTIFAFIALQFTIIPMIILSNSNIAYKTMNHIIFINISLLTTAVILLFATSERRLFHAYLCWFILSDYLLSHQYLIVITMIVSFKLANSSYCIVRKIIYNQITVWCFLNLLTIILSKKLDLYYLMLIFCIIPPYTFYEARLKYRKNLPSIMVIELLITLADKLDRNQNLTSQQQYFILQQLEKLDSIGENEKTSYNKWQQFRIERDNVYQFIVDKITSEINILYSHELQILKLQCQLKLGQSKFIIFYQIEKLIKKMNKQSTFGEKLRFYQLIEQIQAKLIREEQRINPSLLIQHEQNIQKFHTKIFNLILMALQFWIIFRRKRFSQTKMEIMLSKIIKIEDQAEIMLASINKNSKSKFEQIIFDYVKASINNFYKPKEDSEVGSSFEEFLPFPKSIGYILVKNKRIIDMPNFLLNDLQLSKIEADGYSFSDIAYDHFGVCFQDKINEFMKQMKNGKDNFLIPLKVSGSQYFQPYRASIQILPNLLHSLMYIIYLEKQSSKNPMIIYSEATDSIIGVTKNFKKYFNIQKDSFIFQKYAHFLFNADFTELMSAEIEAGVSINCELNIKLNKRIYTQLDSNLIPVIITYLKQYNINKQRLLLFSISKRQEMSKAYPSNQISERFHPKNMQITHSINNLKINLNQTNFCKIPNPFNNIMEQKLLKISQFNRLSFLKIIVILFLLLLAIILTIFLLLIVQKNSIESDTIQFYGSSQNQNNKQIDTYELYTHSCILNHIRNYPQKYLAMNHKYNITALIDYYISQVNKYVHRILVEHTANSITSTISEEKSVYDILKTAKQFIIKQSITELIALWPLIEEIIHEEDETESLQIDPYTQYFKIYPSIIPAIVILIIIFILIASYQITSSFELFSNIYQNINQNQANQFVSKYQMLAHHIYSSSFFKGIKNNNFLKKFENGQRFSDIEQIQLLQHLKTSVGLEMTRDQIIEVKNNKFTSILFMKQYFLSFLKNQSFILLIVILIYFTFTNYFAEIEQYERDFNKVAEHTFLMHYARANISESAALFLVLSYQQTMPQALKYHYTQSNAQYLYTQINSQLPQYFDQFIKNQTSLLDNNLCILELNTNILYRWMQCESVFDGIMTVGYSQAMVIYQEAIRENLFTNISTIHQKIRPNAQYPLFMEILYVRRAIYKLISSLQISFWDESRRYISIRLDQLSFIFGLSWLIFPICLSIFGIFYRMKKDKCEIYLKMFFILPKTFLQNMKITKLILKKQILHRIEMLTF